MDVSDLGTVWLHGLVKGFTGTLVWFTLGLGSRSWLLPQFSPGWGTMGTMTQTQLRRGWQGIATSQSHLTQPRGTAKAWQRTPVESCFGERCPPLLESPSFGNNIGLTQKATGLLLVLSRGGEGPWQGNILGKEVLLPQCWAGDRTGMSLTLGRAGIGRAGP